MFTMPHKLLHSPVELAKLPDEVRKKYEELSLRVEQRHKEKALYEQSIADCNAFIHSAEMILAEMYHDSLRS
jgi:hypothetical protein